tara:strand:+ start:121 stop:1431 length:1311 start_codon:yes stop_codon:yes gene_type:complete
MSQLNIGILGDVVIDVTQFSSANETKMRLGGIAHAARGFWSLNCDYNVLYMAPEYLDQSIKDYLSKHGAIRVDKIGNVVGAPYVFLIKEEKEIGDQGYEFLLRDNISIRYLSPDSQLILDDLLIISGNYDMNKIKSEYISSGTRIHLDLANNVNSFNCFDELEIQFETIFLSTSSDIFRKHYAGDFVQFAKNFKDWANRIILKENRGGARGYDFSNDQVFLSGSHTQPIAHSVGVGDVYNSAYVTTYRELPFQEAMDFSSWMAAEYAVTTYPNDFKAAAQRIINSFSQLKNIKGISLPWEQRKAINIYIAAPDFDFLDVSEIDNVAASLLYHNFNPRRPVKENGQMPPEASKETKRELHRKDMNLLRECKLMVAVLIGNDPGTLIEIGLAKAMGMPVFVYDPFHIAENCMLTETPDLLSSDLDDIISEVFSKAASL